LPISAVSPSEPVIVVSMFQLQEIITQALKVAVEPLQNRVQDLEAKILDLQRQQDHQSENEYIQLQIINQLRAEIHKGPKPIQRDRGEILRALIAANGGKMLRSEARKKMRLSESRFSELLATTTEYIEVKPYHRNEKMKVLILK
jgi:hypothetical protein